MPSVGTALRTILKDTGGTPDTVPATTAAVRRTYNALTKANTHEWVCRGYPRAGFPAAVMLEALRREGITRVRVVDAAYESIATSRWYDGPYPGTPALLITTTLGPVIATPETRIIGQLHPENALGTRFSCARARFDFAGEDLTDDERLDRVDAAIADMFEARRLVGVDSETDPFVSWPSDSAESAVRRAADWAAGLLDRH